MQTRPDGGTATPPRVVAGRYRLVERLGAGGMGTVWRARDEVLDRDVALKEMLFPPGLPDVERDLLRERTRREARAAARLHHPSAVTVYDVVEDGGAPFLVMELVHGRTLADVVRDDGPLPPQRAAAVGLAVLGALEAAHRHGILHRDVKPSNVLLDERDHGGPARFVLTDFGIATSPGSSSITQTGLVLGSPSYIAPERALGEHPGPASDLWSLGATLYTAVEGRPPFDRGEPLATLAAVAHDQPAAAVAAGPLAPVLDGLLARDPGERLDAASARVMLEQVARQPAVERAVPHPVAAADQRRAQHTSVLALPVDRPADRPVGEPVARSLVDPVRLPGRPVRPAPPRRNRAPLVAAALLAGVAVVGGGVALATRGSGTAAAPPAAPLTAPPASPLASPSAVAPTAPGSRAPSPTPAAPTPSSAPTSPPTGSNAVPTGWRSYTGGPGWTVAVPPSYAVGSFDGDPQYSDPATGRTLRVSTTGPGGGKPDPVQDRRDQAAYFARSHPDYREISIVPVQYRGYPAADWEFTYSGLHALNRVFVVDGRGYSLFFQTRATDDWTAARAQFEQTVAAFRPA